MIFSKKEMNGAAVSAEVMQSCVAAGERDFGRQFGVYEAVFHVRTAVCGSWIERQRMIEKGER